MAMAFWPPEAGMSLEWYGDSTGATGLTEAFSESMAIASKRLFLLEACCSVSGAGLRLGLDGCCLWP